MNRVLSHLEEGDHKEAGFKSFLQNQFKKKHVVEITFKRRASRNPQSIKQDYLAKLFGENFNFIDTTLSDGRPSRRILKFKNEPE